MATITGTAAANRLNGTSASDRLLGLGGRDTLNGGGGNDMFDGGDDNDRLVGGRGDDVYIVTVTSGNDTIVEAGADGGTDTVRSSRTFSLEHIAQVENLTLTGLAAIDGRGNSLANIVTGNSRINALFGLGGSDFLDGGGGRDRLAGGDGDDVLIWDAVDTGRFGGTGTDTLRVTANGALNLAGEPISSMEIVQLAGANTLTISAEDIKSGFTHDTLTIKGGTNDAVKAGGGWSQLGNEGGFAVYEKDGATLKVDLDIDRSQIGVEAISLAAAKGANGFRVFDPTDASTFNAVNVSSAGDINGDGFDDLVVGIWHYNRYSPDLSATYVVFGAAEDFKIDVALSSLDGQDGFRMAGIPGDVNGTAITSAGDVNGDGYGDFIVGAPAIGLELDSPGDVYVVYGASSFAPTFDLSSVNGVNGFRLTGAHMNDAAGNAVAMGDVNGDGFGDLIVGAYFADTAGETYVLFGGGGAYFAALHGSTGFNLSAVDGTNGFKLTGADESDFSGGEVSAADINGDGYADVIVGASGAGANKAHVIFGGSGTFASNLDLSSLDGINGFEIVGATADERAGHATGAVGDVNGDGISDFIVGAGYADPNGRTNAGASYVVFGNSHGYAPSISLSLLDGVNGFRISGVRANDTLGLKVGSAGDVNGDGYDDLVVGNNNVYEAQSSYVVFGAASFESNLDLSGLDGVIGLRLDAVAADSFIFLGNGGDFNGDGFSDLVIGEGNPDGSTGSVVFGRDFGHEVDYLGTKGNNALIGSVDSEIFIAGRGNDTMTGGGGADVFRGGQGNDRIVIADHSFFDIDGGTGKDVLALAGAGFELDLTSIGDSKTGGIEIVNLNPASGAHSLKLSLTDLLNLSDTTSTLVVRGGAADSVEMTTGHWTDAGVSGSYHLYTLGAATLKLQTAIASVVIDT